MSGEGKRWTIEAHWDEVQDLRWIDWTVVGDDPDASDVGKSIEVMPVEEHASEVERLEQHAKDALYISDYNIKRAEKAEAEVERLREALERIAKWKQHDDSYPEPTFHQVQDVARAALASLPSQEPER